MRLLMSMALCAAAWLGVIADVSAQAALPKTIKIVVPFSPGASNDVIARAIGASLAKRTDVRLGGCGIGRASGNGASERRGQSADDACPIQRRRQCGRRPGGGTNRCDGVELQHTLAVDQDRQNQSARGDVERTASRVRGPAAYRGVRA